MGERASVVIPTVDRPGPLGALLHSLTLQTHEEFEVVVVVGPPHEDALRALDTWARPIKVISCPVRNLSMARNVGVAAAASDIVAFVDDDGIVEPRWLEALVAALADPAVAVVGGLVMDHHGTSPEYGGVVADRLGHVRKLSRPSPAALRSFPESWEFAYAPGGNAAYRVAALHAVGGFDERITYYLDETDTCLRLIDAGWLVDHAAGAVMHHKSLPSAVRNERRAVIDWTQIVRSRVYFARRHATAALGAPAVTGAIEAVVTELETLVEHEATEGRLLPAELETARRSIILGREEGEQLARLGPALVTPARSPKRPFKQFATVGGGAAHRRVVALTMSPVEVPPAGIRAPLEVRLIVPGTADVATVDLVGDVWTHRTPPHCQLAELHRVLATMHVDAIVTDAGLPPGDLGVPVVPVGDVGSWLSAPDVVSAAV